MSSAMKVVEDAYAAFGRGDIDALLALIPASVEWRVVGPASLPYATLCRSRAEVQKYFDDLLSAEKITRFEPREFIDAGEHIVVLGFVAATIKATGKSFESEWVHIFTVKDGLVTRWMEFFDTAARP
ncbi:nuclear transport factor 2 family protein [Paraburkholderia sediminicola]|uniref:nuclear transport factor 2 family protein n=1 Tax=Paraburkholderia TaxID=1822464 RepID=UPI0038BDD558